MSGGVGGGRLSVPLSRFFSRSRFLQANAEELAVDLAETLLEAD